MSEQQETIDYAELEKKAISKPLIEHVFVADAAAHVFNERLYIYPSHDIETGVPFNDNGDHFAMDDYHILSMDVIGGEVTDHGVALSVKDIPWAGRQLWDSDAAYKDGKYYLYFPLKDRNDIFRIGVAISDRPEGPFTPQPAPMLGSYSIDPAVFEDEDGRHYMYFGGLWGGQLQRYRNNKAIEAGAEPADTASALCPKVVRLSDDMLEFDEEPKDLVVLDENGEALKAGDHNRRFFEASWMHKYDGKYYFSYSTGNTHKICYAIGDSPYGPFIYQGIVLKPVIGWTTHHSIVMFKEKWYLFYHDCVLSKGQTHLRSIKCTELTYDENGRIQTIEPYG
ncbi:glycoside hydrolase family 43 protein [Bacteroidales bacterium]|nr:glycoside hydrolase family 43 protein [Bacteroidales bacterium]